MFHVDHRQILARAARSRLINAVHVDTLDFAVKLVFLKIVILVKIGQFFCNFCFGQFWTSFKLVKFGEISDWPVLSNLGTYFLLANLWLIFYFADFCRFFNWLNFEKLLIGLFLANYLFASFCWSFLFGQFLVFLKLVNLVFYFDWPIFYFSNLANFDLPVFGKSLIGQFFYWSSILRL